MTSPENGKKGREGLKKAIAYARSSLDAADVSRLARALFYIDSDKTGMPEEGG